MSVRVGYEDAGEANVQNTLLLLNVAVVELSTRVPLIESPQLNA